MGKINFQPGSFPVQTLVNEIINMRRGGLDTQPFYQRGYIWNDDFKSKLILSMTKGYPIGNITIRNLDIPIEKGARKEVVDGQQRLTTITNFMDDEFEIKGEIANLIIENNEELFIEEESKIVKRLYERYKSGKKVILKYSTFPEMLKGNFNAFPLAVTSISNADDNQVTEYFRFVQNQERLKAGEILNAMPESILEKYVDRIVNKEKLLKILNFRDNRMEFEKVFYSIIGLFDQKINFGVTDNVIKNYVSNKSEDLDEKTAKLVNQMVDGLNYILDNENKITINVPMNKRGLKLLLLLLGFNYIDLCNIEISIKKLYKINEKLSAFNSAKKNIVEETFKEYSEEDIEEFRNIALITKGAHPYDRVKERVKILSEKIK